MKKLMMVLVLAIALFSAICAFAQNRQPATPAMVGAKFFGVVCEGKWNVGMNSALFQFFNQGDKVFVYYAWGPAKGYRGGEGVFPAVILENGGWGLRNSNNIWTFVMTSEGMIVKYSGAGMDGALLQCKAVGVIYGRIPIPLPADLKITPPTPDVPMSAMSGTWFGIWVYGWGIRPGLLVVENLSKDIAQVVYAVSGSDPKWWRRNATVNGNILSWKFPNWPNTKEGVILKFTLLDDRLEGEFIQDGKTTGTVTMTK